MSQIGIQNIRARLFISFIYPALHQACHEHLLKEDSTAVSLDVCCHWKCLATALLRTTLLQSWHWRSSLLDELPLIKHVLVQI